MTVSETLSNVRFVVDEHGEPTAALLDIATWQQVVQLLEEAEDQGLVRSYLERRRTAATPEAMGLVPWEEVEAELNRSEGHDRATLG
ncbi:MAG: hypothetical protein MUD01_10345 [Chloroflexaceae bacterium]|jgi:hypothetical protein|nr:hypothetical protein [Chloroflexaceae bacterium]